MAYVKTNWVDNTTPINETNLNKIEKGIYDNSLITEAIADKLNPTDTETYKTAELTEGQITDVIGVKDIIIKGQTSQNGEPTPDSPVDVNVVSGSNVINTSNKNLFNKDTVVNKTLYSGSVGQVISIGTNSNTFRCPIFKKMSDKITISANDTSATMRVLLLDKDYKILSTTSYTTLPRTIDTSNCEFIAIFFDGTTITINNNIQIEQNSTATTYEPHQGKELPLDLGSIELCKIGDYQDYFYKSGSKWYLHKEISKVVLDGTEDWMKLSSINPNTSRFRMIYNDVINMGQSNENIVCVKSNNFVATSFRQIYISDTTSLNLISNLNNNTTNGTIIIRIDNNIIADSVEQFKTWLSTHNTIVYYVLATATNTEITGTLKEQLEAIYNAPLYEQTNITQTNNDLPMILDITACKDNINGIKAFIRK